MLISILASAILTLNGPVTNTSCTSYSKEHYPVMHLALPPGTQKMNHCLQRAVGEGVEVMGMSRYSF